MAKPATSDSDWVEPEVSHLITEDDTPMDNPFQERQQALPKDCLTTSYTRQGPYVCMTNVGLYPTPHVEALVPDLLLSLDVTYPEDIWEKPKPTRPKQRLSGSKPGFANWASSSKQSSRG